MFYLNSSQVKEYFWKESFIRKYPLENLTQKLFTLNISQNITGILEIRAKFALKRFFLDRSKQRLIRIKRRTDHLINRFALLNSRNH